MIQALRTAWRSILVNKKGLFQTIIGLVVGVAFIMVVLRISQGFINVFNALSNSFSPKFVYVVLQTGVKAPYRLTMEDMQRLVDDNPDVFSAVSPYVSVDEGLKYGDKVLDGEYSAVGVSDSYTQILDVLNIEQGRWLQHMDIEQKQNVCVVGADFAKELLPVEALGSTVRIQGENYTVVGVLQNISDGIDEFNKKIFVPYSSVDTIDTWQDYSYFDGGGYWDSFYFAVADLDKLSEAGNAIRALRDELIGSSQSMLGIFTANKYARMSLEAGAPIIVILTVCTFIIFLVTGTGIMNITLAAVSKRTREIGVRRAFGARRVDIKNQFLLESVITGCLGGMAGVVIGLPLCNVVCSMLDLPNNFGGLAIFSVAFALGASVGIAVLFSLAPANKAAKMEIVDALNES